MKQWQLWQMRKKKKRKNQNQAIFGWLVVGKFFDLELIYIFNYYRGKTVLGTNKKDPEIIVGSTSLKIRMF